MTHETLTAALAAAQGELPHIKKDNVAKINGGRDHRWVDLATLLAAVRPVLSRHGIALLQRTDIRDGAMVLLTELRHPSGEIIDTVYPVCVPTARHQDMGTAMTYARRYALCALLGIAAEEDDDGATAAETPPVKSAKPKPPTDDELKLRASKAIEALAAAAPDQVPAWTARAENVCAVLLDAGLASSAAMLRQAIEEARGRASDGAFA